jgi:hypothetical protein
MPYLPMAGTYLVPQGAPPPVDKFHKRIFYIYIHLAITTIFLSNILYTWCYYRWTINQWSMFNMIFKRKFGLFFNSIIMLQLSICIQWVHHTFQDSIEEPMMCLWQANIDSFSGLPTILSASIFLLRSLLLTNVSQEKKSL